MKLRCQRQRKVKFLPSYLHANSGPEFSDEDDDVGETTFILLPRRFPSEHRRCCRKCAPPVTFFVPLILSFLVQLALGGDGDAGRVVLARDPI